MREKLLALLFCVLSTTGLFAKEGYIQNRGQITDINHVPNTAVLYLYNGKGFNVQLRKTGFSYDIWKSDNKQLTYNRIDIEFMNMSHAMQVIPAKPAPDYRNYYLEYTEPKAITQVHHYEEVTYENVWPDIDIQFELNGEKPKYNFILHPGAKLTDIRLDIEGAKDISIDHGELLLTTKLSVIRETVPYSYFVTDGNKTPIISSFVENKGKSYGFSIADAIPAHATLVIDPFPTLEWGSFFGGTDLEESYALATDNKGHSYIGGYTESANNIATSGAYETSLSAGAHIGYFARFNDNGTLSWATYYSPNEVWAIVADPDSKYIYLTGSNFNYSIYGSYLSKFDSAGTFIWKHPISVEHPNSLGLDSFGHIYVAGFANFSDTEATPGTHQSVVDGGQDAFLGKYRTTDGSRIWGTYYGGNYYEAFNSIALANGGIYAGGYTRSPTGIATTGALQPSLSGYPGANNDICYSQWDTSGNLLYGTYLGGSPKDDICKRVIADRQGNIYLSGYTGAIGLATAGAYQTTLKGDFNGFLMKMTPANKLAFFTYVGGLYETHVDGLAMDTLSNLIITGTTSSPYDIATSNGLITTFTASINQAYIMKFNSEGKRLWGSYLDAEYPFGLSSVVNNSDDILIAGYITGPVAGTTPGTYQPQYGGGASDGFLMKLSACQPGFAMASGNGTTWEGGTILLTSSGGHQYEWTGPGSFNSSLQNPVILNAQDSNSGTYTVIVTDTSLGCADKAQTTVHVNLAVDDANKATAFRCYPNPTQDQLTIEFDLRQSTQLTFALEDISGNTVYDIPAETYQAGKGRINIDVHLLAPGSYIYRIIDKQNMVLDHGKIVKQ